MPLIALRRVVWIIQQLAGGQVSAYTDVYPQPVANRTFEVRYDYLFGLTGLELEREELHRILEGLDIQVKPVDNYGHPGFEDSFMATIPAYRVDVERPADIAEEVLRIVGFDKVAMGNYAATKFISQGSEADLREDNQTLVSQFLADRGFVETMGNSFVHTRFASLLPELEGVQQVTVLNRLSEDLEALRPSPLFSGLIHVAYNLNRKQTNLRLFEFGKTYRKTESDSTKESYFLSLLLTGNFAETSWQTKDLKLEYHHLSAQLLDLFAKMGLKGVETRPLQAGTWAFGQEFVFRQKTIAKAGRLSPKIAAEFDIKVPVWYAEVDWQWLGTFKAGNIMYQEISRFPEVNRDLSLVIDKTITFEQIKKVALNANRKMIKEVDVFDVYVGPNIGEGKKSYSISFTLQDSEKTLTDDTIDKVMNRVMELLETELGAVIRKG
jgi:phenylalanyl-tRNA synthetase beta chain